MPELTKFTVLWLCALAQSELKAAIAMLDKRYEPMSIPSSDSNTYTLGAINDHNVVIACMPIGRPGLVSASRLLSPIKSTFPNLKTCLFVGIAGGLPSLSPGDPNEDIHLGDVVFSTGIWAGHDPVIPVDYRRYDGQPPINLIGRPDKPESHLLQTLSHLIADDDFKDKCQASLKRIIGKKHGFDYPGFDQDRLFKSDEPHKGVPYTGCESCSVDGLARPTRPKVRGPLQFVTHLGSVASGNSILMDPQRRDSFKRQFPEALCYEMEAAAAADELRPLVIRGISDYCDSHKNDKFKRYAAATAAAVAREFLHYKRPHIIGDSTNRLQHADPVAKRNFSSESNPSSATTPHFAFKPGCDEVQEFSSNFINRTRLVSQMEIELGHQRQQDRKVICLSGMTGSGKSELARYFIRLHRKDYTACLKVDGRSKEHFRLSLLGNVVKLSEPQFADERKQEGAALEPRPTVDAEIQSLVNREIQSQGQEHLTAIYGWLNRPNNDGWVLLVDDVAFDWGERIYTANTSKISAAVERKQSPPDLHLRKYIDQFRQGTIILASQHSRIEDLFPTIRVGPLNEGESTSLIQRILPSSDCYQEDDIKELTEMLHHHPQAIECAARYMKYNSQVQIKTYIERWKACDPDIISRDSRRNSRSLFNTLKRSVKGLSEDSRRFIELCAWLYPLHIWPGLFQSDADERLSLPTSSYRLCEYLTVELGDLSLVSPSCTSKAGETAGGIAVHPVAHKVIQYMTLDVGSAEMYINRTFDMVAEAVPDTPILNLKELKALLPHVEQSRTNLRILECEKLELQPQSLTSVGKLGKFFHDAGHLRSAAELYDEVLKTPGSKEQQVSYYTVMNSRGAIFLDQSRFSEAYKLFQEVRRYLDSDMAPAELEPRLLECNINLAIQHRNERHLDKAESILKETLDVCEKQELKDDHSRFQSYRIKHFLSTVCVLGGHLSDAADYASDAKNGLQSMGGTDSLYTLQAAQQLGSVYRRRKFFDDAAKELAFARKGFEHLFSPTDQFWLEHHWHHIMLQSDRLEDVGSPSRAHLVEAFEDLIQKQQKQLGETHWLTLRTVRAYGNKLSDWGDLAKGKWYLCRAIEGYDSELLKCRSRQNSWARTMAALDLAQNLWIQAQEHKKDLLGKALQIYDEARGQLEGDSSTLAQRHLQDIILNRARILCLMGPEAAKRDALQEVLQSPDISEEDKRWAAKRLYARQHP